MSYENSASKELDVQLGAARERKVISLDVSSQDAAHAQNTISLSARASVLTSEKTDSFVKIVKHELKNVEVAEPENQQIDQDQQNVEIAIQGRRGNKYLFSDGQGYLATKEQKEIVERIKEKSMSKQRYSLEDGKVKKSEIEVEEPKEKHDLYTTYQDNLSDKNVELFDAACEIFEIDNRALALFPEKYDIKANVREYRFKDKQTREPCKVVNKQPIYVSEFDDLRYQTAKAMSMDLNYKQKMIYSGMNPTEALKNRILDKKAGDNWIKDFELRMKAIANKYTSRQFEEIIDDLCATFKDFMAEQQKQSEAADYYDEARAKYFEFALQILFNKACMEKIFVLFYAKVFDALGTRRGLTSAQNEVLTAYFKEKGPEVYILQLVHGQISKEIEHGRCTDPSYYPNDSDTDIVRRQKEYNQHLHFQGCCNFVAYLFLAKGAYIAPKFMIKVILTLIEQDLMEYTNDKRIDRFINEVAEKTKDDKNAQQRGLTEVIIKMTSETKAGKDSKINNAIEIYSLVRAQLKAQTGKALEETDNFKLSVIAQYFDMLRNNPDVLSELATYKARTLLTASQISAKPQHVITFVQTAETLDFKQLNKVWQEQGLVSVARDILITGADQELSEKLRSPSGFDEFIKLAFTNRCGEQLIKDKYQVLQLCSKTTQARLYQCIIDNALLIFNDHFEPRTLSFIIDTCLQQRYFVYDCFNKLHTLGKNADTLKGFFFDIMKATVEKAYFELLDEYLEDGAIDDEQFEKMQKDIADGRFESIYERIDVCAVMASEHYSYFDQPDFTARKAENMKTCTSKFEDYAISLLRRVFWGAETCKDEDNLLNHFIQIGKVLSAKPSLIFMTICKKIGFEIGMFTFDNFQNKSEIRSRRTKFYIQKDIIAQQVYALKKGQTVSFEQDRAKMGDSIAKFVLDTSFQLTKSCKNPAEAMWSIVLKLAQLDCFNKQVANDLIRKMTIKQTPNTYGVYQLPLLK